MKVEVNDAGQRICAADRRLRASEAHAYQQGRLTGDYARGKPVQWPIGQTGVRSLDGWPSGADGTPGKR